MSDLRFTQYTFEFTMKVLRAAKIAAEDATIKRDIACAALYSLQRTACNEKANMMRLKIGDACHGGIFAGTEASFFLIKYKTEKGKPRVQPDYIPFEDIEVPR
tara:strand:- start:496 stop:804 length:309 start_codon:yes stop_codon:yes gene_type:complete